MFTVIYVLMTGNTHVIHLKDLLEYFLALCFQRNNRYKVLFFHFLFSEYLFFYACYSVLLYGTNI